MLDLSSEADMKRDMGIDQDKMMEFIRSRPDVSGREAADHFGVSPPIVAGQLARLEKKGLVVEINRNTPTRRWRVK